MIKLTAFLGTIYAIITRDSTLFSFFIIFWLCFSLLKVVDIILSLKEYYREIREAEEAKEWAMNEIRKLEKRVFSKDVTKKSK